MNSAIRHEIFACLKSANPHPATELEYRSHFELLIAVMLSAQATDKSVNLATRKLFASANTPQKILILGEEKLLELIKSIGLYKTKAKNILATCTILMQKYDSKVPGTREQLVQLPGVGRKTANVILNTAFGEPTIAVDTHIFRVANRTGLAHGKTALAVELKLLKVVPKAYRHDAHHWLILHGRYICKARKPECGRCMIYHLCEYKDKTA
ncbi:endonuclease-3 [Nitrosomonas sp. Nm51]|uniref:endonuclease III n=1 Tax=Nitrosomonas sp. Nm51 TaxID=133720 RepID=UPI0008BF9641|nr:endonuclease III [Nitrosomonas sp. Nm51]SER09870.1 endonuclease-3 [Nitrosomonas sp. Nm51]